MLHQYVAGIFPTGDPPPKMQTPAGKAGAAKAIKDQAPLPTAAPSIPQGGARWMLS